jgi:HAD superfamily hydrolase (TIGR01549 family)
LIEAVIFDLDGTLIQLPIDYDAFFQELKRILKTEKVPPLLETLSKLDPDKKEKAFIAWENAEQSASDKITLNAEGMKIYKKFTHKPRALVTMQGRKLINTKLTQLGLVFDAAITREDSLDRVEQLKIASHKIKACSQTLLFVGNTENDSLAAQRIRCQFLRV